MADRDWSFRHYDVETGGTKHPYERTLTVHHPDTGEEVGYAQYYPPKRKGSPISINNIHSEHPGAGSALMGEMESRHPGSPTAFTYARKRDKNTPSHTHGEHGKPTDWDTWHPQLPDEMHRGFSLSVDPWHGRALNTPGASKDEHLAALHHAMPEGPNVGVHWTTHKDLAHRFAQNGSTDPRSNIPVVLHAKKPDRKDIETRPKELFRHGVFPYDSHNNEFEVPMRRGRQVHVTGISWKPDVEHPDADEHGWLHHTYGEDEVKQHTARAVVGEPASKLTPDPAAILRVAARDRDLAFHVTASWADVQRKAKRIRAEGGVTILVASHDGIGGTVQGEHGVYEALLVYRPGTRKVADWTCGCKWAAYAFDRSPEFRHFEGRKCSHALALQYEAQSKGMFGKEVHPEEARPGPTIVRYDPDAAANVYARPFAAALVASLRETAEDPAEVIGGLMRAGMEHRTAVLLWKGAEHHEDGERRCPHCGGFIGVEAVEHHHCPHCGAPLGGEGHHEGSLDVRPVNAVDDATHRGLPQAVASADGRLGLTASTPDSDVAHFFGRDLREGAATDLSVANVVELGASAQVPQVLAGRVVAGVPSDLAGVTDVPGEGPAVGTRHPGRSAGGVGAVPEQPGAAGSRQAAGPGVTGVGTAGTVDQRFVTGVDADGLAPTSHAGALRHDAQTSKKKSDGPSVSGIALKAHDTGRVLMLQRGLDDPNDPAAGTWEFPGGHHEEGDLTSLHAGLREWEEEVGQPFPEGGALKHVWTSPNGVYQGHVVVIPSEKDLSMKDGRVVPNPDDPKGDCHEQAAWWDPAHARKIPNLRAEVKANTPWKEIANASLEAKTAAAWDPISNPNPQPGRATEEPEHSNTTNPVSTGFATGMDPHDWDTATARPQTLIPSLSYDSVLHDEPEPALPSTYGDERPAEMDFEDLDPIPDNPPSANVVPDNDGDISLLQGAQVVPAFRSTGARAETEEVAELVAAFQRTAAGQALLIEPQNDDIAAAARAALIKEGLHQFDHAEQQELINEGVEDGRRARNLDQLKIGGTHYELLQAALDRDAIPDDLFIT